MRLFDKIKKNNKKNTTNSSTAKQTRGMTSKQVLWSDDEVQTFFRGSSDIAATCIEKF